MERLALLLPAVTVLLIGLPSSVHGQPVNRAEREPNSALDAREAQMLQRLDEQLNAKMEAKLKSVDSLVERAGKAQQEAHEQVSLIVNLMEIFLGLLSIILVVGGVEVWRAARLRGEAQGSIKKAVDEAETGSEHVQRIRDGLSRAWQEVDTQFARLPPVAAQGVAGIKNIVISAEDRIVWADQDTVIVVCDQLGVAVDPNRSALQFIKLSGFWRSAYDYPRASARANRAVTLTPGDADARYAAARTYASWAASEPVAKRQSLLSKAERELDEMVRIEGCVSSRVLHLRGWIADELGRPADAVILYQDAEVLEPENDRYKYDLACSLAKVGKAEEACAKLLAAAKLNRKWRDAALQDPDLIQLHALPSWKTLFTM